MGKDRRKLVCLMTVYAMLYKHTYHVFTLYGRMGFSSSNLNVIMMITNVGAVLTAEFIYLVGNP